MNQDIEKNLELPKSTGSAPDGPRVDPIASADKNTPQSPMVEPGAQSAGANPMAEEDPTISGITLEDYAAAEQITLADAWREIKAGKLLSRSFHGRIYVYPDGIAPEPQLHTADVADLPPLPDRPEGAMAKDLQGAELSLERVDAGQNPEMALLLDHLSLAKEENREILKLTQDSLSKVTGLTDDLVKLKDQVIEAKDVQIEAYRKELDSCRKELARLAQEKEDLEMLARTYTELTKDS